MTSLVSESPCSPETGCITCGDVAVPLRVVLVDDDRGLALCRDEEGRRETVEIALVGEVGSGDELLVHAGTAIAHLGAPMNPGAPASRHDRQAADGGITGCPSGSLAEEVTGSCP